MAPFSVPAPCIVPCRVPVFGGPKSIDTNTKIELFCDTQLPHEMFYTLDGTKPQPYAGIVQGSKTIKYVSSFCLPAGKVTVKAIAIHARLHSISSNVITKCFEVLKKEQKIEKKKIKSSKKKKKKVAVVQSPIDHHLTNGFGDRIQDKELDYNEDISVSKKLSYEDEELMFDDQHSEEDRNKSSCSNVSSISEESLEDETVCEDTFVNPAKQLDFSDAENEVEKSIDIEPVACDAKPGLCNKCEMNLQKCSLCQEMSLSTALFCGQCGKKFKQRCRFCNEPNLAVAVFCQFCGGKIVLDDDLSAMSIIGNSGPSMQDAGVQSTTSYLHKSVQTCDRLKPSPKRRMPSHSPGRGYWHQQLDFICNHLKTYGYNDADFRKSISEPALGAFRSADVVKDEESVTVTIVFSPFEMKKL